ncbi:MAG TPA: Zn-dependent hydrolase [Candidatus Dormibacteraeota bacterium]|jgi:allantoate deiminase
MATPTVLPFSAGDLRQVTDEAGRMLDRLRRHGGGPDGSVTRLVYGEAWRGAMAELEAWFASGALQVRADAAGSRYGRLAGSAAGDGVVLSGSHVDSVVLGGAYDGIAGVVMAGCAIRWLAASVGRPARTLEVLANCEEESSRFASNFWGSRAIAGAIRPDEPDTLRDDGGVPIGEAMLECGLDPRRIGEARRTDLAAFVEPHIEQGPVLAQTGDVIGVVDRIVGVRGASVTLRGVSGHAGTIPMSHRRDALAGAAEVVLGAERLARELDAPTVATVGSMQVQPGGFNQVPGAARFTIDFRHPDDAVLDGLEARLRGLVDRVASERGLEARFERRLGQRGTRFDDRVRGLLEEACVECGVPWRRMPSHAGHDAQLIAGLCPTGMLFVPSQGGHSHRPDERSELDHIGAGIEVLVRTLFRLAYAG